MVISVFKIILVLAILAFMIIVLVSIDHYLTGEFDCSESDVDEMKKDISDQDTVIGRGNVFSRLIDNDKKKPTV